MEYALIVVVAAALLFWFFMRGVRRDVRRGVLIALSREEHRVHGMNGWDLLFEATRATKHDYLFGPHQLVQLLRWMDTEEELVTITRTSWGHIHFADVYESPKRLVVLLTKKGREEAEKLIKTI